MSSSSQAPAGQRPLSAFAGGSGYSAVPSDELSAEYEDDGLLVESAAATAGGGGGSGGWLVEANELLAPAAARASAHGGGGRTPFCVYFCLGLAAVGAAFLGVIASLLARRYPYLGMPQDPPPGSAPPSAQALATFAAAVTWGVVAVALAVYWLLLCRRRVDKAD
jgi:hypothetical protein